MWGTFRAGVDDRATGVDDSKEENIDVPKGKCVFGRVSNHSCCLSSLTREPTG